MKSTDNFIDNSLEVGGFVYRGWTGPAEGDKDGFNRVPDRRVQRRALVRVRPGKSPGTENRFFGLHKRWPKQLSNIWLQNFGFLLVPMGLLAWIAFSVPLLMVNGSYIIAVVSDPLSWGTNLFGTADLPWRPLWPEWVPVLQVPILLAGFYCGLRGLYKVGVELFPDRNCDECETHVPCVRLEPGVWQVLRVREGLITSAPVRPARGNLLAPAQASIPLAPVSLGSTARSPAWAAPLR